MHQVISPSLGLHFPLVFVVGVGFHGYALRLMGARARKRVRFMCEI